MSQHDTQPPAERRAAEAQLRTLISKVAPAHLRLIGVARRALRKRLPAAHEMVYEYRSWLVISFSPSGRGHEGVVALRGSADGVKLYFNRGRELADPEKRLKGSGGLMRWIALEGAATLAHPAVARLIDEAIAANRVPFASAGRGPVIFRASSARPRSKRRNPQPASTPRRRGIPSSRP